MESLTLDQYLIKVMGLVEDGQGERVAEQLSLKHRHIFNARLHEAKPESRCQTHAYAPWDELLAAHIRGLWALSKLDIVQLFSCQTLVVQSFVKVFQLMKEENWALPIMAVVCLDLRLLANRAELERRKAESSSKHGELLEKAAECLMACFRVCAGDNRAAPEVSKKWGMLNLVNQLFKIYFKLSKLHLCKPLIRAIECLPIKDQFPLSQLITFRYYVGRKEMFESRFKEASEFLSFAFERCHKNSKSNKRLILITLIPVRMLLGHIPKKSVLEKYDLLEFTDVVKAVRSGNLQLLNEALQAHEAFFIRSGIYLILEKLKIITYRNLFKKIHLILNKHQLPVAAFVSSLKMMGVDDMDTDEAECIIANLIFENRIKGYISHQHQMVVLSKQNPFPAVSCA